MKVFSLEKFLADDILTEDEKIEALNEGWAQSDDGKTQAELGDGWEDDWAVEKEEWEASRNKDTATIKGSKLEYHLLPPEQLACMAEILNK